MRNTRDTFVTFKLDFIELKKSSIHFLDDFWPFLCIVLRLQAALAIGGFAIRGFDYSRFHFYAQNLLSAGFPSIIRGFSYN